MVGGVLGQLGLGSRPLACLNLASANSRGISSGSISLDGKSRWLAPGVADDETPPAWV